MIEQIVKENCKVGHKYERPFKMAVHVSCSSLWTIPLCAPWFLRGVQHSAGVRNGRKSTLNTNSLTRECPSMKISSIDWMWCSSFLFYSRPSVIFLLLTGHRLVSFFTADKIRPSHRGNHMPRAADGGVWCSLLQLIKSGETEPSLIFHQQALVEHEFKFLPLRSVLNSIF